MKIERTLGLVLILFAFPCVKSIGAVGADCEDFFKELDSAYTQHDGVRLLRLAAETIGKDCWHIAAGQGPIDSDSLRMGLFDVGSQWLFDEGGLIRGEVLTDLGNNLSDAEKSILNPLNVNPHDTGKMMMLLSNSDPSIRWIGIRKSAFLQTPPASIVQKLQEIVADDDYIILENIPIPQSGSSSATNREFSAPLRHFAREQLSKWNQNASVDELDVARAGLENLLDEYSLNPAHKDEIIWAISRLTMGHSPVAEQALRSFVPDTSGRQQAIAEFKKAAKVP